MVDKIAWRGKRLRSKRRLQNDCRKDGFSLPEPTCRAAAYSSPFLQSIPLRRRGGPPRCQDGGRERLTYDAAVLVRRTVRLPGRISALCPDLNAVYSVACWAGGVS